MENSIAPEEFRKAARDIMIMVVQVLDLASKKSFILERWSELINVMIYKNPGTYLIEKLCVIHLFEADYNFVIGTIFGRRTLYSCIDNPTLHSSQWAQPG